ncbi:MAG: radical SAM protein [Candidatus Omnitrophica bacterium]|nr:radical SAM protein [Candidatus Omnitrophota bacterium]
MNRCFLEDTEPKIARSKYTLGTVYLYFKYCNLKCRHCWINPPYSNERTVKQDEVSLQEIISALGECRELGMRSVKISGGEPFTRGDIFELLKYLKENKIRTTMETNGTLIRQKEAKALKDAGVWHVAVSIDGPTAEIHESLRGVEGSFRDTLEGVKYLKKEGINIQIITCLWRGNKEHIKSTIVLAKMLGANSVKINPINSISRADKMDENNETLTVKETIELYRQLKQDLKKEPSIDTMFDIPPAFYPIVNMRLERLSTCGIFNILGILGDGRISICGIGSSVETLVLGKIGKDSIRDIWQNHPVLKEIRESVPEKLEGICGQCILKNYCLGKCRAEAYYTKGSLLAPISFCQQAYEQGLFPVSRLQGEVKQEKYIARNRCVISYSDNGSIVTSLRDGGDYIRLRDFKLWLWNRLGQLEKMSIYQLKSEVRRSGILKDMDNLEKRVDGLVKKNIFLYVKGEKDNDKKDNDKETKNDNQKLNKSKVIYKALIKELDSAKKFGKKEDLNMFHKNAIETIDRHFETKEVTISYLYREDSPALRGLNYGEALLREIEKFKKIEKGTKILEVGAGFGFGSQAFLKSLKQKEPDILNDISYILCDLTFKFLESQRDLTSAYPTGFIQANAQISPFKDSSFDIIIANENIADFTAVKLNKKVALDFLKGEIKKEEIQDPSIKKALEWIKSSSIDISDALPEFIFNLGAFEFMNEIKRILKTDGLGFICEYGIWKGYPKAVSLVGHTEYDIQFNQLIKFIKSLGMDVEVFSLLDFLGFNTEEEIIDSCSLNFLYDILKEHNIDLPYLAYTKEMLKEKVPEDLIHNFKNLKFNKLKEKSVYHNLNVFYALLIKKNRVKSLTEPFQKEK